jgi:hypothetical protein
MPGRRSGVRLAAISDHGNADTVTHLEPAVAGMGRAVGGGRNPGGPAHAMQAHPDTAT